MANGQVVLVTTELLDGGPPVRSVFFVAEEDPAKAAAIIATLMAPNERVEACGPLPEVAVKALGLKPGDSRTGEPATGDTKRKGPFWAGFFCVREGGSSHVNLKFTT
jgi:hypothetical protein